MPAFESFILGEKTAVIFDIGHAYTKCGFAGETGPRFIFPTETNHPNGQTKHLRLLTTVKDKREFLIEFFHALYYKHLLVNPKDRRVVVVESILCTTEFRSVIADVLYNHFEIPSALFAPSHLVTLFTLGLSTALVLDCGFKEAVVLPVSEGYTLLNSWQSAQLGSVTLYRTLKDILQKSASIVDENNESCSVGDHPGRDNLLNNELLEDITMRTCFISPAARADEWAKWLDAQVSNSASETIVEPKVAEPFFVYPLTALGGSKRLEIPSRIRELAVECLFTGDRDQITLATMILTSIQSCPIDVRKKLAANLIPTGGAVNIPGFSARLVEELDRCLELDQFSNLTALKGTFRIHRPPGEPNFVAWLGGAIFGALESLPGRSLDRTAYIERGFLPDWTTIIDSSPYELGERAELTRQ